MKESILIIITLTTLLSCEQSSPVNNEVEIEEIESEIELVNVNRDSINIFLSKPFDLFEFKKRKERSNSGGSIAEDYYYKPNHDGFYYRYFLFSDMKGYIGTNKKRITRIENGLELTVFKETGDNQYKYTDSTEKLIQVKARFNDFDLPELAFVGIDSTTIIQKFGDADFSNENCLVYNYKNYALILKIEKEKVKWLKYLNTKEDINILDYNNIFNL